MTHELWEDPESTLNSLRIEGVSTNDWGRSLIRETCLFPSLWLADKSHQVAKISLKDAGTETRPLPISKQVYPVWGSLQLIASFVWVRGGAHFCFLLRNVSSSQRCLSINNRIIIKWTNVLLDIQWLPWQQVNYQYKSPMSQPLHEGPDSASLGHSCLCSWVYEPFFFEPEDTWACQRSVAHLLGTHRSPDIAGSAIPLQLDTQKVS